MIIISKEDIQPIRIYTYSPNPESIRIEIINDYSKRIIVAICFNGIEITNPVPGTSYVASTVYGVLANGNLLGGDGGRNTSTWCIHRGFNPGRFFISGLTSRTTYKILVQEYTDDALSDYSQSIEALMSSSSYATTNYTSATTRR